MSLKAWSFLVSRNYYLDYRTVVAPDFICKAQISNLLARAADGDLTEEGTAICRKIIGSRVGDLTLVFQIVKATKADIEVGEETVILRDPFGREIYLITGLVFNEALDNPVVTNQIITAVQSQVREAYREFWEFTDPTPAKPSTAFEVNGSIISEQPVILKLVESFLANQSFSSSKSCEKLTLKQTIKVDFPVSSIAFSPDGKFLVSRTDEQTIQQWNLENIDEPKTLLQGPSSNSLPSTIVFSPNGSCIASGTYLSRRNSVWLWNHSQNQEEKRLYEKARLEPDLEPGTILTVAFSPDGQLLVGGSKSGSLIIWDMLSYKRVTLADNLSEVKTIAFTPGGEILISGEKDGIINIWLPKNRLKCPPLVTDLTPINSVTFSSDGMLLAVGCDESLEIWDFKNQNHIHSAKNYSEINSVAFSPDSRVIATGNKDGKISIWGLKKERYILTISEHEAEVRTVVFNPQKNILASCSQDKTIKLWQY
ncbi:WD40 repeat domain-containing protein [Chlorogloeopsis sp. ULAP01]|uniref:WD40 repeat domain-containing protein n=1 Tax=Chlorogloeopsis sp. ULAP01 TaxID=3056483 RepID=UPI0025AB03FF|nr:WD40 repeat domain-containing protein [Chlorogloeopsis sp. ULAP01]MDM9380810.1 WD40 repeat domain-containing protein [Chlorogloeopsis sp. ULAP01]